MWEKVTTLVGAFAPHPRSGHSAVVVDKEVFVFGGLTVVQPGQCGFCLKDCTPNSLAQYDSELYCSLHYEKADRATGHGHDEPFRTKALSDVVVWNSDTYEWRTTPVASENEPQGRWNHCAALTKNKETMVIYGGCIKGDPTGLQDSVALFNLRTSTWVEERTSGSSPEPSPMTSASVLNNKLLVLSGDADCSLFTLDLDTLHWSRLMEGSMGGSPPSPRMSVALACVGEGDRASVWLFGGMGPDGIPVALSPAYRATNQESSTGEWRWTIGGVADSGPLCESSQGTPSTAAVVEELKGNSGVDRWGARVSVAEDGRILVFGGATQGFASVLSELLLLDPTEGDANQPTHTSTTTTTTTTTASSSSSSSTGSSSSTSSSSSGGGGSGMDVPTWSVLVDEGPGWPPGRAEHSLVALGHNRFMIFGGMVSVDSEGASGSGQSGGLALGMVNDVWLLSLPPPVPSGQVFLSEVV